MWTRETYKNMNNIKIFQSTTISSLRWKFLSNFYLISSKRAGTQWTRMMSLNAFLSSHRLQLCRKVCNPFASSSVWRWSLRNSCSWLSSLVQSVLSKNLQCGCTVITFVADCFWTLPPMQQVFPCAPWQTFYTQSWHEGHRWKQLEPLSHSSQNRLTPTK